MTISVIVPFYKGNRYVDGLIDMFDRNIEALNKEYPDATCEILFINDSPQEDVDIHDNPKNNVTVYKNDVNSGIHQSRVNGVLKSQGEYIFMLDQDDKIQDRFLVDSYTNIISNHADVSVCNGINEGRDKSEDSLIYNSNRHQKEIGRLKTYLCCTNLILSPGQCLIKKSSIPKQWIDNIVKDNGSDDLLLWLIMLKQGRKFVGINEKMYVHVHTSNNISLSDEVIEKSSMNVWNLLNSMNLFTKKDLTYLKKSILFYKAKKNKNLKFWIDNLVIICERLRFKIISR